MGVGGVLFLNICYLQNGLMSVLKHRRSESSVSCTQKIKMIASVLRNSLTSSPILATRQEQHCYASLG